MFLEQVPLILCTAPHIVQPMCACAIFFEQESAPYFSSGDSAAAFAGHKFPGFNEKAVGQSKIYTMRAEGEIWGANNIPNDPLRLGEQCSL